MQKPTLTTDRLMFVPSSQIDDPFLAELITDPAVRRYLGGAIAEDHVASVLARYHQHGKDEFHWTVVHTSAQSPIGLVSLTHHKNGEDFELSYQFTPASWGSGYGHEACRAVLDFALSVRALPRVIAETQSANVASVSLLRRLGMTQIETVERFAALQCIYST